MANELAKGEIDVIINVLDVNNLERNLLLTLQLQRLGIPMVGALNLYDEFEKNGCHLDDHAYRKDWACRSSKQRPATAAAYLTS